MKYSLTLAAFAALAAAAPTETIEEREPKLQARQSGSACAAAVTLAPGSNPFTGRTLHANSFYASEVTAAVAAISDASLKTKAAAVGKVGSFLWLDTIARAPLAETVLSETPCGEIAGLVIYDLPGRDCAAKASNGELATGQLSRYKTEYIDPIVATLKKHPNVAIALIIEPDSLPNLVTNANLTTCSASAQEYKDGTAYALAQLNLPNVAMYMDAGHGGWLGWDANLQPGANMLASVYKQAGSPKQVFGIATNTAGWNAWSKNPGEFEGTSDAKYNKCQDEKRYIDTFCPLVTGAGMPCHAVVDTGRNAVQGLRLEWGDWCNVNGAGFGVRPTSTTGDSLVDAFVWIKPGGESDGTSDSSANRYDSFCGKADAFKPAPQAGTWNQAYFEMLVKNAVPSF